MLKGKLSTKETQTGWRNRPKGTLWNSTKTNAKSCTWGDMGWGLPAWLQCGSAKKGSGVCVRQWAGHEPAVILIADPGLSRWLSRWSPDVPSSLNYPITLQQRNESYLQNGLLRNTWPVCSPVIQKWELWLLIFPLCWACEIIAFSQHLDQGFRVVTNLFLYVFRRAMNIPDREKNYLGVVFGICKEQQI